VVALRADLPDNPALDNRRPLQGAAPPWPELCCGGWIQVNARAATLPYPDRQDFAG